jgi:hypothetical protein
MKALLRMTDSFDGGVTELLCVDRKEAELKQLQQARELSAIGITGVKFEIVEIYGHTYQRNPGNDPRLWSFWGKK